MKRTDKSAATEMRSSYLVQRLNKPYPTERGSAISEVFAFGGGLRNGGLSSDAMDLLRTVFAFDYMGAAEFEWGAVPKALDGLAKAERLTAFEVVVPLSIVPPNWRDKSGTVPDGQASVWVLCRPEHAVEVGNRVMAFAAGEQQTKERVGLPAALRPFNDWDNRVQGWLELDNGYFFFADRVMFEQTARLFGAEVPEVVA